MRRQVGDLADRVVHGGLGGSAETGETHVRRLGASRRTMVGSTQSPPVGTTRTVDSRPAPTSVSICSQPGMKCST